MNVTLSLTELGILVIAAAMVVAAVAVIRLSQQVNRTSSEMERLAQRLEPRVEKVLEELASELRGLQSVTEKINGIGQSAEALAATVTRTAIPLIEDVKRIRQSKRYVVAAGKGVAAGVRAWKGRDGQNGREEGDNT